MSSEMDDKRVQEIADELIAAYPESSSVRFRHKKVDEYEDYIRLEGTKGGFARYAAEILKASIYAPPTDKPDSCYSFTDLDWLESDDSDMEIIGANITDDFSSKNDDPQSTLMDKIIEGGCLALFAFGAISFLIGAYKIITYSGKWIWDQF